MSHYMVWNDTEEDSNIARFRLVQTSAGIELRVVNKKGVRVDDGSILTIENNGTLLLHGGISRMVGLNLTGNGHIVVREF